MNWRPPLAAVLAVLALGWDGNATAPLDGGYAIQFEDDPAIVAILKMDPCQRREKGGWHRSIGHCRDMTPPHRITGVWITAFEEMSFLEGETRVPDPNDPRRYQSDIELDRAKAISMAGRSSWDPDGDAYVLTFVGRRTRDPLNVDCQGEAMFAFVVDRLLSARYLGAAGAPDLKTFKARFRQISVTRRHGGAWGRLEEEAVKRCGARDPN